MAQSSWKYLAPLAALVALPLITTASPVLAQPPPPSADATQKATAFFTKGGELFKAKRFGAALEQFEQSYRLVPSPNSHLYIARCRRDMGETRAAYLEFDKVLAEAIERGEKYAPTRQSARTEPHELTPKLGFGTVNGQGAGPGTPVRLGAEAL